MRYAPRTLQSPSPSVVGVDPARSRCRARAFARAAWIDGPAASMLSFAAPLARCSGTAHQPPVESSTISQQLAGQAASLVWYLGDCNLNSSSFRTAPRVSSSAADLTAAGCADHGVAAVRSIASQPTRRSGFGDVSDAGQAANLRATQPLYGRGDLPAPARGVATSSTEGRDLKSRGSRTRDGSVSGPGSSGTAGPPAKHVLYRGLGMVPFRLLVRFKVFQLAGVAAVVIPISTFLSQV